MRKFLIPVILLCVVVAGCRDADGVSASDVLVYNAFVDTFFAAQHVKEPAKVVAVNDSTDEYPEESDTARLRKDLYEMAENDSAMVISWSQNTRHAHALQFLTQADTFGRKVGVVLVDHKARQQLQSQLHADIQLQGPKKDFVEQYWSEFYRQFPNSYGLMHFSGVGYNRAGDRALFTFSWSCGGLCGQYTIVVMKRVNGHWGFANARLLMIS